MGLAEKRAIKEFQDQKFDTWKKQISDIIGFEPTFHIEWETLSRDGEAHLFDEGYQKVYFIPLVNAFKAVCKDQMGRDAVKAALKEIHILNKSGNYSPSRAIEFKNGVLRIDHEPTSNMQDIDDRSRHLVTVLENGL